MEFRFGSYNRFGCSKEADVDQVFFTELGKSVSIRLVIE
jgi:hypothetical protein